MPKSASPASPGPLTAHPITATSNACGYFTSRSSTTRARFSTPTLSLPHDGHAIITGPRSRRPSALRISHATSTSFTGSAVSETRIVSPMPSMSRAPIPTALLIEPANGVPASVTPRCRGYGTRAASIRYARIIVGTCDALTLILKSRKPSFSRSSTCSSASTTSASAVSLRASSWRCSGSEPAFAPIRIGMRFAFAARTTSATLSGPPMLPGLIRTAATPASIAFSASEALKWMSAMTGIGERRTSFGNAAASSFFGTATRASSQPADASAAICAVVASTSCVFVSVIDWTTTGAPPPIFTLPTLIWRSEGIPSSSLAPAEPVDVVRKTDEHQHQEECDPDGRDALVDLPADRPTAQTLHDREEDVPAVERQQREQVEDRKREADEPEHEQVPREADRDATLRDVDDT